MTEPKTKKCNEKRDRLELFEYDEHPISMALFHESNIKSKKKHSKQEEHNAEEAQMAAR